MMQVSEASYYISRTKAVAHPHLMTSLDDTLEVMGYFRGAVNAYAKCFVSSGTGKITLQVSEVIGDHPERLAAHERLMQLRHKYAAHNDDNEFEGAEIEIHETPTNVEVDLRYLLSFVFDRMYELDLAIRHLELHIVDRQAPPYPGCREAATNDDHDPSKQCGSTWR